MQSYWEVVDRDNERMVLIARRRMEGEPLPEVVLAIRDGHGVWGTIFLTSSKAHSLAARLVDLALGYSEPDTDHRGESS